MMLIGEFKGSPNTFEQFEEQVLEKVIPEFFKDDTTFYVKNVHDQDAQNPYTDEKLLADFSPVISSSSEKNSKMVFLVNWGWHSSSSTREARDFLNVYNVANNDIINVEDSKLKPEEFKIVLKNGLCFATVRKFPEGFTVVYFLWDAFHQICDGAVTILKKHFLAMAINYPYKDIFLDKYHEIAEEGGDSRLKGAVFTSILQRASSLENKDEIIKEMLKKVPYSQIIPLLKQTYLHRIGNRSDVNKITKPAVEEWLKDWADKKWPIYVMFGHNFTISAPVSSKLNQDSDMKLIEGMIVDLKKKFPKIGLYLDDFSVSEIFNNKISGAHPKISEYIPMKSGDRLSRVFSSAFNDPKFDIELSKFIQEKEFSSNIHLSIDPMDFFTSSVTKHKWTSCHNVIVGQYGVGSVAYAFDEGTIVAFASSGKLYEYDLLDEGKYLFQWNSKLWRQMVYMNYSENSMIFSREYPQDYRNNAIALAVRELLEKTISDFTQTPNVWVKKNNGAKKTNQYKVKGVSGAPYDDIPSQQTVFVRNALNKMPKNPIVFGQDVKCPIYGTNSGSSSCFFSRQ